MSKASKKVRFDPGQIRELTEAEQELDRAEQLIGKESVREALEDIFDDITKGFDRQCDRSDDIMDYWDVYNCKMGPKQVYNGNTNNFVPIVHSAIEARKTRYVNQMFPRNGRYVDAISEDGEVPFAETALLEHYIRRAKIRTQVAPALVKNGDIEGQYTIQVTWEEFRRHVAQRVQTPITIDDFASDEEMEEIAEEELIEGRWSMQRELRVTEEANMPSSTGPGPISPSKGRDAYASHTTVELIAFLVVNATLIGLIVLISYLVP